MIKIRLYFPSFIDVGDDIRRDYEAETWDELRKTDRLAAWEAAADFDHWCLSDHCLMVEKQRRPNGERLYWVVAYVLEGLDQLPLPKWVAP